MKKVKKIIKRAFSQIHTYIHISRISPLLDQNIGFYRSSETVSGKALTVSGKALAAGSTHHSPAASALPLTKVALSN